MPYATSSSESEAPEEPCASHVLQLAAYCLLVEEAYGQRPTHGTIRYTDQPLDVAYDLGLEDELLQTLNRMRADLVSRNASHQHSASSRCTACGHREQCDQRLK
jgi:CRISPR-associated exonuclease Cas4